MRSVVCLRVVVLLLSLGVSAAAQTSSDRFDRPDAALLLESGEFVLAPRVAGHFEAVDGEETIHVDGNNSGSASITGASTWIPAARLTPAQDCSLKAVLFYQPDEPLPTTQVRVYDQGIVSQPGALLVSFAFAPSGVGWQRADLSSPLFLAKDRDFWPGVQQFRSSPNYPRMGKDAGPVVDYRGDFFYWGGSWYRASTMPGAIPPYFNWNIRAVVTGGTAAHDVGATKIAGTAGTIDSTTSVTPACSVYNYGEQTESYQVRLRVGGFYEETAPVSNHAPGTRRYLQFPAYSSWPRGQHAVVCSTELTGDMVPDNDRTTDIVFVRVRDVGTVSINTPSGAYPPGRVIIPSATWRNLGNTAADFEAWMVLTDPTDGRVYVEKVDVAGLAAGRDTTVNAFPSFTLNPPGAWLARCSTHLAGDVNPANDLIDAGFAVALGWPWGWVEVEPVPAGALVKDGGCLAMNQGNSLIYAVKGNKSNEFCVYEPIDDVWTPLAAIPEGPSGKPLKKGCDGVTDGQDCFYLTRGNNTLEFWRYHIPTNTWESLPDVPEGLGRKGCKRGTDLAYVPGPVADYVYLLKGYGTEFYRFDVENRVWEPLSDVPTGARAKVDEGSWLCWDEGSKLYFLKAKYGELWPYELATGTWGGQLSAMPLVGMMGKKKKPKDGGAGAWYEGSIFALKGGNTCEFWRYAPGDSWHELDTMPSFGSTGRKKRVKTGGDIVSYGIGAFFALKGNKSLEMWRYVVPLYVLRSTPRAKDGVSSGVERNAYGVMRISPNPLVGGFATLRCNLPKIGPAAVSVYDASGRCVLRQAYCVGRSASLRPTSPRVLLDLRSLCSGVYLVRLEVDGFTATRKLVIEH